MISGSSNLSVDEKRRAIWNEFWTKNSAILEDSDILMIANSDSRDKALAELEKEG